MAPRRRRPPNQGIRNTGSCRSRHRGALLRLDPIADRDEYAVLASLLADAQPQTLAALAGADRPEAQRLALRIANLRVEDYGVWARGDAGSLLDDLDDPAVRCLIVDIGCLPTRQEQGRAMAMQVKSFEHFELRAFDVNADKINRMVAGGGQHLVQSQN